MSDKAAAGLDGQPWWRPEVRDHAEAQRLLSGSPNGTFLVRHSSLGAGHYAVDVVLARMPLKALIAPSTDGSGVFLGRVEALGRDDGPVFATVVEVVEANKSWLTLPAPASPAATPASLGVAAPAPTRGPAHEGEEEASVLMNSGGGAVGGAGGASGARGPSMDPFEASAGVTRGLHGVGAGGGRGTGELGFEGGEDSAYLMRGGAAAGSGGGGGGGGGGGTGALGFEGTEEGGMMMARPDGGSAMPGGR